MLEVQSHEWLAGSQDDAATASSEPLGPSLAQNALSVLDERRKARELARSRWKRAGLVALASAHLTPSRGLGSPAIGDDDGEAKRNKVFEKAPGVDDELALMEAEDEGVAVPSVYEEISVDIPIDT